MSHGGAFIKNNLRLDDEEEKKEFTFAFSSFNAEAIAATYVERRRQRRFPERWSGSSRYGSDTSQRTVLSRKEGPQPTRTLERSEPGGVGRKG